ncbi:hypothetical protein JX265_007703 [Neoarthrinium moseri]|uniref:Cytochrome P450 n=1 Tax=Neoarthrinium moseri TaxID=1658444 RepID=A0A9P9WJA4_9PEZI|nr:uncharacterized protein JN550_003281 [Neoarthrinium moseri]KAI1866402.1 hypothetical protein JX265_007703 [Neoarthrinium moseri]KAI1873028.1 hypothetical protein JN550_003281 [Neoarthrinium moseri]
MFGLSSAGLALAGFVLFCPLLATFSYLWVALKVFRGKGLEYEHLRKYGSMVRVGPNYVLTDDPETIRQINGARSIHHRDDWYRGAKLDPDTDTTISHRFAGPHDNYKAKASFGYSGRDTIDFEVTVDEQIIHLIEVIKAQHLSKPDQLNPLDFAHYIRYFTLDTITAVAFGKRFGFIEGGDLYGYTASIEKLLGLVATAGDVPLLRKIFISPFVARFFAPKPTDSWGIGKVMGLAHETVEDRLKSKEKHSDMVSSFLRHGLTAKEIKAESLVQLMAGADTTATVIRTGMLYLSTCPRVYQRLREEMKEAISSGKVSSPIRVDEAKQLPYLQAVIYESFRMRPPATYGFYKKVPPGGETYQGKFLPEGTAIGSNFPAMVRLESVFGQDSQRFRPERFLDCSAEKKTDMIRVVELLFGYGRWQCAGKVLALVELNKIFFELVRAFDWQVIYPGQAWDEEAFTATVQKDLWMSITEAST